MRTLVCCRPTLAYVNFSSWWKY